MQYMAAVVQAERHTGPRHLHLLTQNDTLLQILKLCSVQTSQLHLVDTPVGTKQGLRSEIMPGKLCCMCRFPGCIWWICPEQRGCWWTLSCCARGKAAKSTTPCSALPQHCASWHRAAPLMPSTRTPLCSPSSCQVHTRVLVLDVFCLCCLLNAGVAYLHPDVDEPACSCHTTPPSRSMNPACKCHTYCMTMSPYRSMDCWPVRRSHMTERQAGQECLIEVIWLHLAADR